MSGNIKEHKGLNNLVGNITSKIEKHIETGKINPETLKREAETLVKDGNSGLGNITGMMENNEGFMKDMMSKMAGFMGDNVDPGQLQEMMKNMNNPELQCSRTVHKNTDFCRYHTRYRTYHKNIINKISSSTKVNNHIYLP